MEAQGPNDGEEFHGGGVDDKEGDSTLVNYNKMGRRKRKKKFVEYKGSTHAGVRGQPCTGAGSFDRAREGRFFFLRKKKTFTLPQRRRLGQHVLGGEAQRTTQFPEAEQTAALGGVKNGDARGTSRGWK